MKTIQLTPKVVGTRVYDNTPVTITDPGYTSDQSHGIISGIQIKPGEYTCVAWKGRYRYAIDGKQHSETRIMMAGIYLDGKIPSAAEAEKMIEIGKFGVDAGMAGIFQNKPDLDSDEEWFGYCDAMNKHGHLISDFGFATNSGFGDGYYTAFAMKTESEEITAIELRF